MSPSTPSSEAGPSTPRQTTSTSTSIPRPKPAEQSSSSLQDKTSMNDGANSDLIEGKGEGPASTTALSVNLSSSPSPKVSKKQTVDQLREGLAQRGLDTKGKKETLWRRLVNAIHRASLRDPPSDDDSDYFVDADTSDGDSSSTPTKSSTTTTARRKDPLGAGAGQKVLKQPYKSFLCFDVEATCRPGKEFDWPNEIIEFPVVLLRWAEPDAKGKRKLEKVDHFRSYVRPTWRPILTDFCKSLTGITQETVDAAPVFPEMLKGFEKWLDKWDLRNDKGLNDAVWVTDGPWDLRDFVPKQLHITPITPHPSYLHGPYLNLKFAVQAVLSEEHRRHSYASERPNRPPNRRALSAITTQRLPKGEKTKSGKVKDVGKSFYFNIPGMVEALNLGEFEGRQHSGLDDATNIARILIALSEKNVVIEANGTIQPLGSGKRYPWMGQKGEILWEDWMSTNKELGAPTSGGVKEAREATGKDMTAAKVDVLQKQGVEEGLEKLTLGEEGFVHVSGVGVVEEAKTSKGPGNPAIETIVSRKRTARPDMAENLDSSSVPTVKAAAPVQLASPIEAST
ncbi:hypothetical protein IAU59_003098 [Kwoniella sp. CBS 9459]